MDSGRRSAALTLPIIYAMPFLIYRKNLRIPRWAIVGGFVLAFIVVYAFPAWRGSFKEHEYLQTFQDHPLSEILEDQFSGNNGKPLEIADGMIVTGARYERANYQWGAVTLYNQLLQNYFPGSLIGYDIKDSLRVGEGISQDWVRDVYGLPVASYTAKSGYEDLFSQFSFFGCIVMYWIGRGFRKVHEAASRRHDGRAVIFLCFFVAFPAGLAYAAVIGTVILQIPLLLLMLLAFRWCVVKSKVPRKLMSTAPIFASTGLSRTPSRQSS
jgi:hypothetical protein